MLFFPLSNKLGIAFSFHTYCCGTVKCSISDGGKEGKEVTSELDVSIRDSRFPCTPVYNFYMVEFFHGGQTLGFFSSALRTIGRRVLC